MTQLPTQAPARTPKRVFALIAVGVVFMAVLVWQGFRLLDQARVSSDLSSALSMEPPAAEVQAAVDAVLGLQLADLDGQRQAVAQWRGRVLVVNYWASWCKPCVDEMPAFSRLQKRFAAAGVQFIGIGVDEPRNMRAFVEKTPVGYPLLVADLGLGQQNGLQIKGLPYTLVIGRDGRLAGSRLGRFDETTLASLLQRLSSD